MHRVIERNRGRTVIENHPSIPSWNQDPKTSAQSLLMATSNMSYWNAMQPTWNCGMCYKRISALLLTWKHCPDSQASSARQPKNLE